MRKKSNLAITNWNATRCCFSLVTKWPVTAVRQRDCLDVPSNPLQWPGVWGHGPGMKHDTELGQDTRGTDTHTMILCWWCSPCEVSSAPSVPPDSGVSVDA